MREPFLIREKVLQISTIVKSVGAIGLLAMDISSRSQVSAHSDAITSAADALLFLSSEAAGDNRERSIEIIKMRSTDHLMGRSRFTITKEGLKILANSRK